MVSDTYNPTLHRTARITAGLTFLLVIAGGLVTSRDAGLAVPDWPLSFGSLNPPHWYAIESVRTEHGHRLVAACVALCTFVLAGLVHRREPRAWVRRTTALAVFAVLAQAGLGGLRVLELSTDLAFAHGGLGQLFFVLTILIAAATSPKWQALEQDSTPRPSLDRSVTTLVVLVLMQLVLGLNLRHLVAASGSNLLSAPSFYGHVGVGVGVGAATVWVLVSALREAGSDRAASLLRRPAVILVSLVGLQLVLGFATFVVTSRMDFDRQATALEGWLPTIHVGVGALFLATSALLLVRSRIAGSQTPPSASQARAR